MNVIALLKTLISVLTAMVSWITSSNVLPVQTSVAPEDFRITAYVVASDIHENMDFSHFGQVTDFILFGAATFNENGEVDLSSDFEEKINILKNEINKYEDKNFYLSIIGPGSQSTSSDWYEQMADLAQRHTNAFESGNLQGNIKSVLEKYEFDGIFFDYEYPIEKEYWNAFDEFIVSLDEYLTDSYKIGVAIATWDLGQSKAARDATDIVAVMSYDTWDNDGNHATVAETVKDIIRCRLAGYDMSKLDLGLPFYGRPTTGEGYWYAYKNYSNGIDENGLIVDSEGTNLTFSFNTYDVIKQKTELALKSGMGGVMVWHYACDTPADSGNSLFDAVAEAKNEAIVNSAVK